jgi:ubiquinone/menaquinone biosynthesis C-methylase UbiE
MKKHIRQYYEQLYQGEKGARVRQLGGKSLAVELGYPEGIMGSLPDEIWESFLPCGNVLPYLRSKPGDRVLNLGCGAGADSIILKLYIGVQLTIVNLDTAFPVLKKVRGVTERFFPGIEFELVCADGESLPFEENCFDGIILNGVFNLFVEKSPLIFELYRVLKPGGLVAGADLCRRTILPDYFASEPDAWVWCMGGALTQDELNAAFESCRFTKLDLLSEHMDEYFDRMIFSFRKGG